MDETPGLEECLKVLKGERDEQRLVGLVLATKLCKGDDHASIRRVYDALGVEFLDRLLRTGMGGGKDGDAYLQLSVTLLAAICRVPEIASSRDMVSKVPYILEILHKGSGPSVFDECYEFLFLVSTASEDGVGALYESCGINVIASHMPSLPDASHSLELAVRLVHLIVTKFPLDIIYTSELSSVVVTIARLFALLHNALKFEALDLLSALISSKYAQPLHHALKLIPNDTWATYIRIGIAAILQNRVASIEKFQALVLADSLMCILGEDWLVDERALSAPAHSCLLLVLESSRVEVAVLLNELAYLKYEASKTSSETIPMKQRNLAIALSLIEKVIKLISKASVVGEGSCINEKTILKVITGLNETIGVVLEFLRDAKEHGQKKGDDLLASVRIVGSYLAQAPMACQETVEDLLEYILCVEGEDEPTPFYCICFMLPWLCQMTMATQGCRIFASVGGLNIVAECLAKLIHPNSSMVVEDSSTLFLACDTLMNVLLKKAETPVQLDTSTAVTLLRALTSWADTDGLMASTICSLILDSTSEEALLNEPHFNLSTLNSLSRLIATSMATSELDADLDLRQILTAAYARWADRFPHVKQAVNR